MERNTAIMKVINSIYDRVPNFTPLELDVAINEQMGMVINWSGKRHTTLAARISFLFLLLMVQKKTLIVALPDEVIVDRVKFEVIFFIISI